MAEPGLRNRTALVRCSPVAQTSISGLTPLTTVGFRVSVNVNKQPPGEWSQVVSILVC
jgi:hypothetical protein